MHLKKSKVDAPGYSTEAYSVDSRLVRSFIAAQDPESNLPGKTPPKNPSKPLNFLACGALPDQVDCSDLHFSQS
jgi:hypothetical protein